MANTIQPFPGPRPFEREDRDYFFGRTRVASDLTSLIMAHQIVVLYAQSGAGKTSLLKAKVLSTLEQRKGFQVFPVARVKSLETDEKPTETTNTYMFNALRDLSDNALSASRRRELTLKQYLTDCPRPQGKSDVAYPTACPRVLVFDQFEELFTLYPERYLDREKFFNELRDALNDDPRLRVVLSMREDYIAELDPYVHIFPDYLRTRFRMEKLRKDGAKQALEGPLNAFGKALGESDAARMRFDTGVAEKLVDDLRKITVNTNRGEIEVVGEFVEPVHLQIVGKALFEKMVADGHSLITERDLQSFGSVNQALTEYFERAIGRAASETGVNEGAVRRWCDRRLLTPENSRSTVLRRQHETAGLANAAIDVLEAERVIRSESRDNRVWYELSHDKLIDPLRQSYQQWLVRQPSDEQLRLRLIGRAEDWVASNRTDTTLLLSQSEVEAARPWVEEGAEGYNESLAALVQASQTALAKLETAQAQALLAEQARSARRLRYMIAGLAAMLLITVLTAVAAVAAAREARRQSANATSQSTRAQKALEEAQRERTNAANARDNAIAASGEATKQTELAEANAKKAEEAKQKADEAAETAKTQKEIADRASAYAKVQKRLAVSSNAATNAELIIAQQPAEIEQSVKYAVASLALDPLSIGGEQALRHGVALLPRTLHKMDLPKPESGDDSDEDTSWQVRFTDDNQIVAFTDSRLVYGKNAEFSYKFETEGAELIVSDDGKHVAEVKEGTSTVKTLGSSKASTVCYDRKTEGGNCVGNGNLRNPTLSPQGRYLTGFLSTSKSLRVWDTKSASVLEIKLQDAEYSGAIRPFSRSTDIAISWNEGRIAVATKQRIVVYDLPSSSLVFEVSGRESSPSTFAVSPNGQYLAATAGVSGDPSATVQIWKLDTTVPANSPESSAPGRPVATWIQESTIDRIVYSRTGQYLATVNGSTVTVWEMPNGKEISRVGHSREVDDVVFSRDEEFLATSSADQTTRVWQVLTGNELFRMGHEEAVTSAAFSPASNPEGRQIVTATDHLHLWDISKRGGDFEVPVWEEFGQSVQSHNGLYIAFLYPLGDDEDPRSRSAVIQVLDTTTGKELSKWRVPYGVSRITFSSDDSVLLTASPFDGQPIRAWAIKHEKPLTLWTLSAAKPLTEYKFNVPTAGNSVRFSGNGAYAVGIHEDGGFVNVQRLADGQVRTLPGGCIPPGRPIKFEISYDGERVLVTDNRKICAWSVNWAGAAGTVQSLEVPPHKLTINLRMSRGGPYFAYSVNSVWKFFEWPLRPIQLKGTVLSRQLRIVVFSPDGTLVALGERAGGDGVHVFDLATGKLVRRFTPEGPPIVTAFSNDSAYLVTGTIDLVQAWSLATGTEVTRLEDQAVGSTPIFSPNNTYLITRTDDDASLRYTLLKVNDLIDVACKRLADMTPDDWVDVFEKLGEAPQLVCRKKI